MTVNPIRVDPAPLSRTAGVAVWAACVYTCIHVLYTMGFEGEWYRLEEAMAFTADPPFRHRVLFVLLADGIRELVPSFHAPRCYFITQILAAAVAFAAIRPWAARWVGERLAIWSQPLLLAMLVPTFTYWTFYDLGIVALVTLALLALAARRWGLYVAILGLATLNHENAILLLPVAVLLRYRSWRIGAGGAAWVALQVLIYAAIRVALFRLLPVEAAWQEGKVAWNLGLIARPELLAKTVVVGAAWAVVVASGWRRVPRELAICLLLVPELAVVTFLFGQWNELRQFDAALPAMVAAVLCALSGGAAEPRPAWTAARASDTMAR